MHKAAAIRNRKRLADMRLECCKVRNRQATAARLNIGSNAAGQIAFVEITRSLRGQMRQRRLQRILR